MITLLSIYIALLSPSQCLWSNEVRNSHEVYVSILNNETNAIDGLGVLMYNYLCLLPDEYR